MELAFEYIRKRREFGQPCFFDDNVPSKTFASIPTSNEFDADYTTRNPVISTVDITPQMAEHEVNTDRVIHRSQGMRHVEGGWPENIDSSEVDQVDRYLKRAAKEPKIRNTIIALGSIVETAVKQNNTIDIYEKFFANSNAFSVDLEPPSARVVAVLRDPSHVRRTVTAINWHPDGTKIAVAYSVLKFQDERLMATASAGRISPQSYVWEISSPNVPFAEISPPSPLVSIRFNQKTPDILVGGSYNGMVHTFDVRKPRNVITTSSAVDKSHYDPVYDVFWVQSKTNSQFVSVSTDGRLLWWDSRKLTEPTDEVVLADAKSQSFCGSSMEYNIEAGASKYLVGTEQGNLLYMNLRRKAATGGTSGKSNDGTVISVYEGGKHHGPIVSLQRNYAHPTMAILSVGDWCAKVWSEKNKGPIMQFPYSKALLTGGCWSPTRPGVFFLIRDDGVLDIWDLLASHTAPVYSHKVSDIALSSIAVQGVQSNGGGRYVAIGDINGNVSLLEISSGVCVPQSNEKVELQLMFDRESRREDNLERRALALARAARAAASRANLAASPEDNNGALGFNADEEQVINELNAQFVAITTGKAQKPESENNAESKESEGKEGKEGGDDTPAPGGDDYQEEFEADEE